MKYSTTQKNQISQHDSLKLLLTVKNSAYVPSDFSTPDYSVIILETSLILPSPNFANFNNGPQIISPAYIILTNALGAVIGEARWSIGHFVIVRAPSTLFLQMRMGKLKQYQNWQKC